MDQNQDAALYLHSTHSPLNAGARAKWDDGNTLIVAQACQSADLVHILRPHHSIRRLTPRSRQASEVCKGVEGSHPLFSRNLGWFKDLRTGTSADQGGEHCPVSGRRMLEHSKQVAKDPQSLLIPVH